MREIENLLRKMQCCCSIKCQTTISMCSMTDDVILQWNFKCFGKQLHFRIENSPYEFAKIDLNTVIEAARLGIRELLADEFVRID